ncbi:MAG: hypothetical protein PQ975_11405 [Methanobacterium sp.]
MFQTRTQKLQIKQCTTKKDTQFQNPIENENVLQIDTSGIVMQSTDYSCGPAALATVLQKIGGQRYRRGPQGPRWHRHIRYKHVWPGTGCTC